MIYTYYVKNFPALDRTHVEEPVVRGAHAGDFEGNFAIEVGNGTTQLGQITNIDTHTAWFETNDLAVLEPVPASEAIIEHSAESPQRMADDAPNYAQDEPVLMADPEVLKDHINPSHYQGYIVTENETLQWLEAMQYLPRYRNPESFIAAVELQGRKYFDRNGGKDDELQELQKGLWYFKFLVAYLKNGAPIRVKDIDGILGVNTTELDVLRRLAKVINMDQAFVDGLQQAGFSIDDLRSLEHTRAN